MKGQVVADFVVDHKLELDDSTCVIKTLPWKLFFDGSVCSKGQRIGCAIMSLGGAWFDMSVRLEFACTNNEAEHEALLQGVRSLRGQENKGCGGVR
jgi:hypothetical protein